MIEHEALAGVTIYEAGGFLQLPIADQEIVGEIAAGELGNAAVEAALVEEALRLGLHNLPYADQLGVVRKLVECGRQALCKQRGPAYDSADRITLTCTVEQPMRLLQARLACTEIAVSISARRSKALSSSTRNRGAAQPWAPQSTEIPRPCTATGGDERRYAACAA